MTSYLFYLKIQVFIIEIKNQNNIETLYNFSIEISYILNIIWLNKYLLYQKALY